MKMYVYEKKEIEIPDEIVNKLFSDYKEPNHKTKWDKAFKKLCTLIEHETDLIYGEDYNDIFFYDEGYGTYNSEISILEYR